LHIARIYKTEFCFFLNIYVKICRSATGFYAANSGIFGGSCLETEVSTQLYCFLRAPAFPAGRAFRCNPLGVSAKSPAPQGLTKALKAGRHKLLYRIRVNSCNSRTLSLSSAHGLISSPKW
jgi:hypothetical protein